jgi:hypothetical protein
MSGRTRSKRGNPYPLIVEPHPETYTGYPFITLIQYRKRHSLNIVDNSDDKAIRAYVLDLCGPADVNEELLITAAHEWSQSEECGTVPISIAFARLGIAGETSKVYRSLNTEFVTRVIGPLPKFDIEQTRSVKRRRRKPVPAGVQIIRNQKVEL